LQRIIPKEDKASDSFNNLIPECIKQHLPWLQTLMSEDQEDSNEFKVINVENGVRIFQREERTENYRSQIGKGINKKYCYGA